MAFKLNPFTGKFDQVESDLNTGSFSAANNVSVAADVTDLDLSGINSTTVTIRASLDATADDYVQYFLDIYETGGDYALAQSQSGSNSLNLQFSITSAGQVQYTSDNYAGFVSLTLDWKYIGE